MVEFIAPTPDRFEVIADLAVFRRGQPQALWQLLERQASRYLVEHFQYQRLVKVVLYSQTHIAPAAQRQVAGEGALQAGRRRTVQADGVEQGKQRQAQQQSPPEIGQQRLRR